MTEFLSLGPREMLLLAVAGVAFYLLLLVVRLRRTPPTTSNSNAAERAERAAVDLAAEPREIPSPATTKADEHSFAQELAGSARDRELRALRGEIAELRGTMVRLDEELRQLKATRSVSPLYSEAMQLAQRGELPAGIAARCGISIGEAELVAALARREFSAAVARELNEGARDPES